MGNTEMDTSEKGSKAPASQVQFYNSGYFQLFFFLFFLMFGVWIHGLIISVGDVVFVQEQTPTTSSATVHPDWTGFQVLPELVFYC